MAESAGKLLQQTILKALSQPRPAPQPPDTSTPAAANPAIAYCLLPIAYCLEAYTNALQASLRTGNSEYSSERAAKAAYRSAMPPLTGSRNIRDFVACIAHAMAIDTIDGRGGAKLLYAAQVANAAQNTQRRIKAKSNSKTNTNTAPQPQPEMQLPNVDFPATQA